MSSTSAPVVSFYGTAGRPYGVFSNFHLAPITIESVSYPSVEHYFQCQKFLDLRYREIVRFAPTPNQARVLAQQRIGRGYKWRTDLNSIIEKHLVRGVRLRTDWEQVKDDVMFTGLKAKFSQHPSLAKILLETGESSIVEASPTDWYWGCGKDRTGKNKLGCLLVDVRSYLRRNLSE
jgi:ribA/ribD-fused uncharacterized protein